MSTGSRFLHDIAATGDAKALSEMLIGEVDVNIADRVSRERRQFKRLCGSVFICHDLCGLCIYQNGSTALTLAAENGHRECLSILLAHGAEVNKARETRRPVVCGVCSIASLQDVLYVYLLLKGCFVTFVASAANYSLATQLS